ncbi:GL24635 [Drosophila persimilis]|uniref:GL24635 n=1 Tax=Drosophila persimilis TaxID=7234 RepID=B4H5S0_DROPE|nr:GL24635 [Drosophila persimilis]
MRGENFVKPSRYFQMSRQGEYYQLIISEAFPEDEGTYKCVAENKLGSIQTSAQLKVRPIENLDAPPTITALKDVSVTEGMPAQFKTTVTGKVKATSVQWFREGQLIPETPDFQMIFDGNSAVLLIGTTYEEDSGIFTVRVTSSTGQVESSAKLTVKKRRISAFQLRTIDSAEDESSSSGREDAPDSPLQPGQQLQPGGQQQQQFGQYLGVNGHEGRSRTKKPKVRSKSLQPATKVIPWRKSSRPNRGRSLDKGVFLPGFKPEPVKSWTEETISLKATPIEKKKPTPKLEAATVVLKSIKTERDRGIMSLGATLEQIIAGKTEKEAVPWITMREKLKQVESVSEQLNKFDIDEVYLRPLEGAIETEEPLPQQAQVAQEQRTKEIQRLKSMESVEIMEMTDQIDKLITQQQNNKDLIPWKEMRQQLKSVQRVTKQIDKFKIEEVELKHLQAQQAIAEEVLLTIDESSKGSISKMVQREDLLRYEEDQSGIYKQHFITTEDVNIMHVSEREKLEAQRLIREQQAVNWRQQQQQRPQLQPLTSVEDTISQASDRQRLVQQQSLIEEAQRQQFVQIEDSQMMSLEQYEHQKIVNQRTQQEAFDWRQPREPQKFIQVEDSSLMHLQERQDTQEQQLLQQQPVLWDRGKKKPEQAQPQPQAPVQEQQQQLVEKPKTYEEMHDVLQEPLPVAQPQQQPVLWERGKKQKPAAQTYEELHDVLQEPLPVQQQQPEPVPVLWERGKKKVVQEQVTTNQEVLQQTSQCPRTLPPRSRMEKKKKLKLKKATPSVDEVSEEMAESFAEPIAEEDEVDEVLPVDDDKVVAVSEDVLPEEEVIPSEESPAEAKQKAQKKRTKRLKQSSVEGQPQLLEAAIAEIEKVDEVFQEISQKTITLLKKTEDTRPQFITTEQLIELDVEDVRRDLEMKVTSNIIKKEKRRVVLDDSQPLPELELITQKRIQEGIDRVADEELIEDQQLTQNQQETTTSEVIGQERKLVKKKKKEIKPPRITEKLRPRQCVPEEPTVLECKVEGVPFPEINWYFNDILLFASEKYEITVVEQVAQLKIAKVTPSDVGVYTCEAKNEAGVATSRTNIILVPIGNANIMSRLDEAQQEPKEILKPPTVTPLNAVVVPTGGTLRFEVQYDGLPRPEIKWMRNGREIVENEEIIVETTETTTVITVINMTRKRTGKYEVWAKNKVGEAKSSGSVVVSDSKPDQQIQPPRFVQPLEPKYFGEHEVAILEAVVESEPLSSFQWFVHNEPIKSSNECRIVSQANKSTLLIEDFQRKFIGPFTCRAENVGGSVTSTATVNLLEALPQEEAVEFESPRFTEELAQPVEVMDGEALLLQCRVRGKPTPKVEWYHNEEKIAETKETTISQDLQGNCQLQITEVFPENEGQYKAVASNKIGKTVTKTNVKIQAFEYIPDSEITGLTGSEEDLLDRTLSIDEQAPKIIKKLPEKIEPKEGEQPKLEVKVIGRPKPKVKWLRDDEQIFASEEYQIENFDDGTSVLVINNVYPDDWGTISFEAYNPLGVAVTTALFSVEGIVGSKDYRKPEWVTQMEEMQVALKAAKCSPSLLNEMRDSRCVLGETAKFRIQYAGNPQPDIQWYFNNVQLRASEKYRMVVEEHEATLEIMKVTQEDCGYYSCKLINEIGMTMTRAKFEVSSTSNVEEEVVATKRVIKKKAGGKKTSSMVKRTGASSAMQKTEIRIVLCGHNDHECLQKSQVIEESEEEIEEEIEEVEEVKEEIKEEINQEIKEEKSAKEEIKYTSSKTIELKKTVELIRTKITQKTISIEDIHVISQHEEVQWLLESVEAVSFGASGEAALRDLATIGLLLRYGCTHYEITYMYEQNIFISLKKPESQAALVQLVEREGHEELITQILSESSNEDETILAATVGFKAFIRMIQTYEITIEIVIRKFVREDFISQDWKICGKEV